MSRLDELLPKVELPAGERETAKIDHFTLTEEEAARFNLSLMFGGQGHRAVSPGSYTRLHADGQLQMTDTPAERRDHLAPVRAATGTCLVTGLGLGMIAQAMARKSEVSHVLVIERNQDVIDLVAPHLSPKVEVICADALEWKPPKGERWDVIWHDIWPTVCLDDAPSRNLLSRRYARRWRVYHGAWAKDEIKRMQSEARRSQPFW